jgi:hypothetical protein
MTPWLHSDFAANDALVHLLRGDYTVRYVEQRDNSLGGYTITVELRLMDGRKLGVSPPFLAVADASRWLRDTIFPLLAEQTPHRRAGESEGP